MTVLRLCSTIGVWQNVLVRWREVRFRRVDDRERCGISQVTLGQRYPREEQDDGTNSPTCHGDVLQSVKRMSRAFFVSCLPQPGHSVVFV